MSERYRPLGYGTGEYEEKRSRFIGEIWPVRSEEQAKTLIAQVKKHYPDARHHCWAWILPDGTCRWSDDGEPGGTAGGPIANILKGGSLYGVLCTVTRYFGGTLLGSGGLVRAYSKAAAQALAAAGTEPDPEKTVLTFSCPWDSLNKVHHLLRQQDGTILSSDYESDPVGVVVKAELLSGNAETFIQQLKNITAGRVNLL